MATTTNFGWETPDDTDLVKDGALAIRTLGSAIDTSLVDLKGGTTGQVLSKTSNTDMDFTWVTSDDANAIQNAIVDAKGDLITATAADTPARLAVGTNGQVLTADSTTATGLKWADAAGGGGMTQLASGSLSGSTLTLNSISGTYKDLRLIVRDLYPSTDSNIKFWINNITNASTYIATGTNTGSTAVQNVQNDYWFFGDYNNTDDNNYFEVTFFDYANTTTHKTCEFRTKALDQDGGTYKVYSRFGAQIDSTAAITRIDFATISGTFSGGTYILYGVS